MKIGCNIKEQLTLYGEKRIGENIIFQGLHRGATTVRRTLEDTIG